MRIEDFAAQFGIGLEQEGGVPFSLRLGLLEINRRVLRRSDDWLQEAREVTAANLPDL